jgi:hypothetical protein
MQILSVGLSGSWGNLSISPPASGHGNSLSWRLSKKRVAYAIGQEPQLEKCFVRGERMIFLRKLLQTQSSTAFQLVGGKVIRQKPGAGVWNSTGVR